MTPSALAERVSTLPPDEQVISLMQAVSDAMARAGDLESSEPPSNASSRVEWAPSTCSSSEKSATGTHFLGGLTQPHTHQTLDFDTA